MRTLFIFLLLPTVLAVAAQTGFDPNNKLSKTNQPGTMTLSRPARDSIMKKIASTGNLTGIFKNFPDTIVIGGSDIAPVDHMPNAFIQKIPPPAYKDNNGRGFDIYESLIDGMPILTPDSANKASLNNGSVKKIQGIYQLPNRKNRMVPRGKNYRYPQK